MRSALSRFHEHNIVRRLAMYVGGPCDTAECLQSIYLRNGMVFHVISCAC